MNHRQRRNRSRVDEIEIEGTQLRREQLPLVDQGARRETRDVELGQPGKRLLNRHLRDRIEHLLADHQQLAFECVLVGNARTARDDCLADHGHGGEHVGAKSASVARDLAPAEHDLPLDCHDALEMSYGLDTSSIVAREETHRDGIAARCGQADRFAFGPRAH